jgi:predicted RNase H-like HicB family nuclease
MLNLLMTGRDRFKELSHAQERDMKKEIIFLVEEAPEGGYTARALGHNIFTEADSFEELKKMVQDAMQCHFEAEQMPRLIRLHMVKDEVIAV